MKLLLFKKILDGIRLRFETTSKVIKDYLFKIVKIKNYYLITIQEYNCGNGGIIIGYLYNQKINNKRSNRFNYYQNAESSLNLYLKPFNI